MPQQVNGLNVTVHQRLQQKNAWHCRETTKQLVDSLGTTEAMQSILASPEFLDQAATLEPPPARLLEIVMKDSHPGTSFHPCQELPRLDPALHMVTL